MDMCRGSHLRILSKLTFGYYHSDSTYEHISDMGSDLHVSRV